MPSTRLSIHFLRIIFRRTFPLVIDYGAPAGARISLIFVPGAVAPRLIYDAAAAAKKRQALCQYSPPFTRLLATHFDNKNSDIELDECFLPCEPSNSGQLLRTATSRKFFLERYRSMSLRMQGGVQIGDIVDTRYS
jgi:hypothetical protein